MEKKTATHDDPATFSPVTFRCPNPTVPGASRGIERGPYLRHLAPFETVPGISSTKSWLYFDGICSHEQGQEVRNWGRMGKMLDVQICKLDSAASDMVANPGWERDNAVGRVLLRGIDDAKCDKGTRGEKNWHRDETVVGKCRRPLVHVDLQKRVYAVVRSPPR